MTRKKIKRNMFEQYLIWTNPVTWVMALVTGISGAIAGFFIGLCLGSTKTVNLANEPDEEE